MIKGERGRPLHIIALMNFFCEYVVGKWKRKKILFILLRCVAEANELKNNAMVELSKVLFSA